LLLFQAILLRSRAPLILFDVLPHKMAIVCDFFSFSLSLFLFMWARSKLIHCPSLL
jgi:hypothetical protein